MPKFVSIARSAFAFLEKDYGFSVENCATSNGGGHVTFVNKRNRIAVKVEYEYSMAFVFVMIYRLVDGNMLDNVLPITDESVINCFDFNDALTIDKSMKPSYDYPADSPYFDEQNGLQYFLNDFADRLQNHGGKLLSGDFAILLDVEKIIKQRARRLGARTQNPAG